MEHFEVRIHLLQHIPRHPCMLNPGGKEGRTPGVVKAAREQIATELGVSPDRVAKEFRAMRSGYLRGHKALREGQPVKSSDQWMVNKCTFWDAQQKAPAPAKPAEPEGTGGKAPTESKVTSSAHGQIPRKADTKARVDTEAKAKTPQKTATRSKPDTDSEDEGPAPRKLPKVDIKQSKKKTDTNVVTSVDAVEGGTDSVEPLDLTTKRCAGESDSTCMLM